MELRKNAAERPNIDRRTVVAAGQKLLWGPVPQGCNVFGVISLRGAVDLARIEIDYFDDTVFVYDHICRLEIPVHDPILMNVANTFHYLLHHAFYMRLIQDNLPRKLVHRVHFCKGNQFLEVNPAILLHKEEQALQVKYVFEANYVRVVELLEDFDFSQQTEREAVVVSCVGLLFLDDNQVLVLACLFSSLVFHFHILIRFGAFWWIALNGALLIREHIFSEIDFAERALTNHSYFPIPAIKKLVF